MNIKTSKFGNNYLLLALRLKHFNEKYLTSYYGPPKLKTKIDNEPKISPKKLLKSCIQLKRDLFLQGFDKTREEFLMKMIDAFELIIKVENGENIPILERVKKFSDMEIQFISDTSLFDAVEKLHEFYGREIPLHRNIRRTSARRGLLKENIIDLIKAGMKIVKKRAYKLFTHLIPRDERVIIESTQGHNWKAFCRYIGNFTSRIEINIDAPYIWTDILPFCAHEGYPGHHMEGIIKEHLLYEEQNLFEQCIFIPNTPPNLISEGIGEIALDVLFSISKQSKLALELCPNSTDVDIDNLISELRIWKEIKGYTSNFAYHILVDEWSVDKLFNNIRDLKFLAKSQLKRAVALVRDPFWGIYYFNYYMGLKLIRDKFGMNPSPKDFELLLTQPLLPSSHLLC